MGENPGDNATRAQCTQFAAGMASWTDHNVNNLTVYEAIQQNPGDLSRYKAVETFGMQVKSVGKTVAESDFAKAIKDGALESVKRKAQQVTGDLLKTDDSSS